MLAGLLVVLGVLAGAGLFMLGAASDTGAGVFAVIAGGLLVTISIWAGILSGRKDGESHTGHGPAH